MNIEIQIDTDAIERRVKEAVNQTVTEHFSNNGGFRTGKGYDKAQRETREILNNMPLDIDKMIKEAVSRLLPEVVADTVTRELAKMSRKAFKELRESGWPGEKQQVLNIDGGQDE